MDGSSSFSHGLILVEGQKVKIMNLNVRKGEKEVMQRNSFDYSQMIMDEEHLGFKQGTAIAIRNQIEEKYKTITL